MPNLFPCLVLASALFAIACSMQCPVWTTYNSTEQLHCKCGARLRGIVSCDPDTLKIMLLRCYCMTYDNSTGDTVIGPCSLWCQGRNSEHSGPMNIIKTGDPLELDAKICKPFNRTGQLCSKCLKGHGLPVYSYSLSCVECSRDDLKYSVVKYVTVAFLPLTLFYFVVITFKVSIATGEIAGYILLSQLLTSPTLLRWKMMEVMELRNEESVVVEFFISGILVWNLDFFRPLYSPFCIHPDMTTLQVLALDYLVAVYPLFLIFLTYTAVLLHDRYSIVVKIWRPAYGVFSCIRREWNIRGSLVQAFATFLVLSYVKILNVSFDLLLPAILKDVKGNTFNNETYLANDAELVYFGREHLPYGILAIIMLSVFNILPTLLLLLYPCGCFQKCLTCCGIRSVTLHTFMDALQGCYRYQPRDCRYFAGIYLCVRMLFLATLPIASDTAFLSMAASYFTALSIALVLIGPYKKQMYNNIDVTLFLGSVLFYLLSAKELDRDLIVHIPTSILRISLGFALYMYGVIVTVRKVVPVKYLARIKGLISRGWKTCFGERKDERSSSENHENLPYRLQKEQEFTPLLE